MRSLTFKLTLAFLLVGLTGAVLVAFILQYRTRTAFDQFIVNQQQQTLIDNLVEYYQTNGSWEGVATNLDSIENAPPHPAGGNGDLRRNWMLFTLVGSDQQVVFSFMPEQIGKSISTSELDQAIVLKANNQMVGWLLLAPIPRDRIPNSPEERFLQNVSSATLVSALVATLLALTLGWLLAYTMTRSLRELTQATVEIARGRFGRQVRVRSKDELGELAASFNQISLDLERATQTRRQMTADIAHDLRSPLSVLSGYAEALSDGKLPGNSEIYGILHQETKHLSRLVDDLRTLSLADAGELPLVIQPVQLPSFLDRIAVRHAVTAQQKGLTLRVETEPDLPSVNVDIERMSQVFDNLITNAFRYVPQGGEIILKACLDRAAASREAAAPGAVLLQVQDNGCGISPDELPHIFDRFYRGDKSRQSSEESGLGLAIAKSLVEAHHGTLTVESVPASEASSDGATPPEAQSAGTTFTIHLPANTKN